MCDMALLMEVRPAARKVAYQNGAAASGGERNGSVIRIQAAVVGAQRGVTFMHFDLGVVDHEGRVECAPNPFEETGVGGLKGSSKHLC